MTYIYVLKLHSNKYYVGKTEDPNFRLETHFSSGGAAWTKKYKPISIHELRPDCESKDETNITQEYMKKYGIDNVRGGPWCGIDISAHESTIKLIIDSESDNCYKCGKQGHFSNQCANKYNKYSKPTTNAKFSKKTICDRCGREGHTEETCYAKSDINGYCIDDSEEEYWSCEYCGKEFETKKGCSFHENVHCKKKPKKTYSGGKVTGAKIYANKATSSNKATCYKCGKQGHYANTCYSKKVYNGYSSSDDY